MKVAIRIRWAVVQHEQWACGVIPLVQCYLVARVEGKNKRHACHRYRSSPDSL